MKNYYRIMLGAKSVYADECFKGNFIGVDFLKDIDFTGKLPNDWREEELAEDSQIVKGVIIALEDDIRIRRALSVTSNIEFYRYQVTFKLFK